jgi:hypothetical protein
MIIHKTIIENKADKLVGIIYMLDKDCNFWNEGY